MKDGIDELIRPLTLGVPKKNRAESLIHKSRNKLVDVINLNVRGVFSKSFQEYLSSFLVGKIGFILLFGEKMKQHLSALRITDRSLILSLRSRESSSVPNPTSRIRGAKNYFRDVSR
jgi:hypothetical protein